MNGRFSSSIHSRHSELLSKAGYSHWSALRRSCRKMGVTPIPLGPLVLPCLRKKDNSKQCRCRRALFSSLYTLHSILCTPHKPSLSAPPLFGVPLRFRRVFSLPQQVISGYFSEWLRGRGRYVLVGVGQDMYVQDTPPTQRDTDPNTRATMIGYTARTHPISGTGVAFASILALVPPLCVWKLQMFFS
ncbi:uncharacterized protein LOC110190279 [Drosophila serrata]|uniref:uncharacterized protein LOC110190279 n=1 Tax=Drosophila serrata TaxID=7274 RepID=UPI000A1D2E0E|nr:uncharacterized protein LOC110190279 [Drosophila serrata]